MLQGLPGISVVPHQCDDAEQHRRRAKDDPSVQRRFHTQKVTDISESGEINLIRIFAAMQTLSGLEQCSVTLPQMRQGAMLRQSCGCWACRARMHYEKPRGETSV
jgi:hypothetical protein